nr:mitotic spindle checkpoint protein BUBR1 [Ipomoea batatas]
MDPETEFLASKQETGNEWELFKENVRPLKRGRNISLLNDALKSHSDFQLKKSLLDKRRFVLTNSLVDSDPGFILFPKFNLPPFITRRLIEAVDEYKGEDPLQPWLECIKWVQESFPPGGDSSGLVVIYEQCVRTCWHDDRYKDDLRYLKVWLEYAENCVDAEVIFSFLEANKIGQTHSSFYVAYALHMESKNKIRTADEIFNRGLSINAQPIEKLKEAYRKFLGRSMRKSKAVEEDSTENQLPARSFGTLLARGGTGNQTTETSDFSRKKLKPGRAQVPFLPIYKDKNTDIASSHHIETSKLDTRSWHCLGARGERNKENNAIPSKWTSNKIPQRAVHRNNGATATAYIEIFVDDECNEHAAECGIDAVSVYSCRKSETENRGEKVSTLQLRQGDGKDIKKPDMAEHLASIFGTEKDRVNCPFYFKIGACRHGDRCSRLHNRPTISPTLLLSNMYHRPDMITPGVDAQGQPIDPRKIQEHFEDFYEDIFEELSKFGEIESLNVCDNLADHMIGNVYVQFKEEDHAAAALQALQGRFYSGRPIIADFSPVTDFREATCRQYEENSCNRGGYCNFMHVKMIGRELRRKLFGRYRRFRKSRSRSRSASPHNRRDRDRREYRDYRERDDYRAGRRQGRHESDSGRRRHENPKLSRSPIREGSEERRARIEQWNREREERQS